MDAQKFNHDVRTWSRTTLQDLKSSFAKHNIQHRARSPSQTAALRLLRNQQRYEAGLTNRISFKFPRHMVFVHKGVGKGVPIEKQPTSNRRAKPWFNEVMDQRIEGLADIVANDFADLVVNATRVKIQ